VDAGPREELFHPPQKTRLVGGFHVSVKGNVGFQQGGRTRREARPPLSTEAQNQYSGYGYKASYVYDIQYIIY
jgi:hypothetical protein